MSGVAGLVPCGVMWCQCCVVPCGRFGAVLCHAVHAVLCRAVLCAEGRAGDTSLHVEPSCCGAVVSCATSLARRLSRRPISARLPATQGGRDRAQRQQGWKGGIWLQRSAIAARRVRLPATPGAMNATKSHRIRNMTAKRHMAAAADHGTNKEQRDTPPEK